MLIASFPLVGDDARHSQRERAVPNVYRAHAATGSGGYSFVGRRLCEFYKNNLAMKQQLVPHS